MLDTRVPTLQSRHKRFTKEVGQRLESEPRLVKSLIHLQTSVLQCLRHHVTLVIAELIECLRHLLVRSLQLRVEEERLRLCQRLLHGLRFQVGQQITYHRGLFRNASTLLRIEDLNAFQQQLSRIGTVVAGNGFSFHHDLQHREGRLAFMRQLHDGFAVRILPTHLEELLLLGIGLLVSFQHVLKLLVITLNLEQDR